MSQLPDLPYDLNFDDLAKVAGKPFADALKRWLTDFIQTSQLNQQNTAQTVVTLGQVLQAPSGTVAQLNASVSPLYRASPDGRIVNVTDDADGPCIAVSNNGQWLKLTLGAQIS